MTQAAASTESIGTTASASAPGKAKFATVWLDGCSGCHMSFLDIDERLLTLSDQIDVVYSPLVDFKDYPDMVDLCLVEGSVSTDGDLEKVQHIREHTKTLISLGNCAVNAAIPAMRNKFGVDATLACAYGDQTPDVDLPPLLATVQPVHKVVPVDVQVPGCPPSNDTIFWVITELLAGRQPDVAAYTKSQKATGV